MKAQILHSDYLVEGKLCLISSLLGRVICGCGKRKLLTVKSKTLTLVCLLRQSHCCVIISVSDCSEKGVTLETSAFLPFTVANLRFQPSR